jgi:hypothetical protein
MPIQQRDEAIESEPDIFSVTDHYRNYPAVLVTLANVRLTRLQQIIEEAWTRLASRRQLALKTGRGCPHPQQCRKTDAGELRLRKTSFHELPPD